MNVHSDKINCYVEGIRVPIIDFSVNYGQNQLSTAKVTIPIGGIIHPRMWASALVHITYLDQDSLGFKKEKLFFEGWCVEMMIQEDRSIMQLVLESKFSCLNYNTTLDYTAPKKYGLQNLEEGIRIYVGNEPENDVQISLGDLETGWKLSERYMYLADPDANIDDFDVNDPESSKLFYTINRAPLAERFAFSFFEDIAYSNFDLTKSPVDRLNLLVKVDEKKSQRDEESLEASTLTNALSLGINVGFDETRSKLVSLITDTKIGNGQFSGKTGSDIGGPQGTGATVLERVVSIAINQVGVKEVGYNRGPQVEQYLAAVGLSPGNPWCAAGLSWCVREACKALGIDNKFHMTGGTHDLLAWAEGAGLSVAKPKAEQITVGDMGFVDRGGGHGHAWIVVAKSGDNIDTVHFNSKDAGVPSGGVARKNMSASTFDATIKWYNAFK